MPATVTYPDIVVQLSGEDGNAFNLIALVRRAMRDHGVPSEKIDAFTAEARKTKSYDDLLQFLMKTVNVE